MNRRFFLLLIIVVLLAACGPMEESSLTQVTLYKSPTCECCSNWAEYLRSNGFQVEEVLTQDMMSIKDQYKVPSELRSCHTAVVDGYVVEGHVPAADINRLLSDGLAVTGIAVSGMPAGSPGMDIEGFDNEPFDVVLFGPDEAISIYAQYP